MPAHKVPKLPRSVLIDILRRAGDLELGQELFIPATSRTTQQQLIRNLFEELSILAHIDPSAASVITVTPVFRDSRFWALIRKTLPPVQTIFIKNEDGAISKQSLIDMERITSRNRRINLMRLDGFTEEQITELEGKE